VSLYICRRFERQTCFIIGGKQTEKIEGTTITFPTTSHGILHKAILQQYRHVTHDMTSVPFLSFRQVGRMSDAAPYLWLSPIFASYRNYPFSLFTCLLFFPTIFALNTKAFHNSAAKVDEIYALLGNYAVQSANFLSRFRDNLSVPSSRVKNPVRNYNYTMRNCPEEHRYHLLFFLN